MHGGDAIEEAEHMRTSSGWRQAPRRWLASVGALAVLGLLAVVTSGCGGDDSSQRSSSTSGAPLAELDATGRRARAGERYEDPQGAYTMTIGDTWQSKTSQGTPETEYWLVAPAENNFAANVNVITQSVPGVDLERYLDISLKQVGTFDVVRNEVVQGRTGNDLGVLEFIGTQPALTGDKVLHFLAYVSMKRGQAVVATLTSLDGSFPDRRDEIEPYLQTLQAQ